MTGRPYAVPVPKGYRIGSWEVREPLASGAFATVYEAVRHPSDAPPDRGSGSGTGTGTGSGSGSGESPHRVALKFLPTGTRTPRQLHHLRDLAEREVQLLRRLRSPG